MEYEQRIIRLEEDVSDLKTGQAETKVYTKMILDSLNKMDVKIDNLNLVKIHNSADNKKKEPFWDSETKKNIIKWGGIIVLVVVLLLAGRDILELSKIIPK